MTVAHSIADAGTEPTGGSLPERLVLYDGLCGLCDQSVQWILAHDPRGAIRFATLQGPVGERVVARHPELPPGIDSVLFVEQQGARERVYWRSRAAFAIVSHLPAPWSRLAWLRFVPAPLTDLAYRLVARIRYRIWGKLDACRIPLPGERARFLD